MTADIAAAPLDKIMEVVRQATDDRLAGFFDSHPALIADPDLAGGHRLLREFVLSGGKRIRPILCYWGWRGAGGDATWAETAITVGAALELYHAGLLIHDDIMDGSDLRRGRPTVHRSLHRTAQRPAGEPFGTSAAILLGVLAQGWADELLGLAEVDDERVREVRTIFARMRSEAISGQYLDILAQAGAGMAQNTPGAGMAANAAGAVPAQHTPGASQADDGIARALTVVRFKSAKYTVERPLQIGGTLAGAGPALLEAYSRFGLPLGEAFQLRDDILGVFGDPAVTGKPAIDDLREGKQTVLFARAAAKASGPQREQLEMWHGSPILDEENAAVLRQIIIDTGALAHVESLIDRRAAEALSRLGDPAFPAETREAMTWLVDRLTNRIK